MRHVDLAAHLEKVRRVGQLVRNVLNGHDVLGHVLTDDTVAACRAAHQLAHAVLKADRKAVDLGLDDVLGPDACLPHAGVKLPQLVKRERILQALHLDGMGHFAEFAAGRAAHMLRGRAGRDQLGVFGLDLLELTVQSVVLEILQLGGILVVVKAVVFFYDDAQFFGALAGLL